MRSMGIGFSVLVVDDDGNDRLLLGQAISCVLEIYCQGSFRIFFASNIDLAKNQRTNNNGMDLYVIDDKIGDASGPAFIHELRDDGERNPIVIVSASNECLRDGLESGASAFIKKGSNLTAEFKRVLQELEFVK